jgi:branched-chain amino acid aminotransferase
MDTELLKTPEEWLNRLQAARQPFHEHYYAMYSSIYDGIVTDPTWMLVPADDHLVHRGDGVFETLKCINGSLYNLAAHLDRMDNSLERLNLQLPVTRRQLTQLISATTLAGEHANALVRVLVSRGPGSLGVNPYDCPSPQLYIMASHPGQPFMQAHPEGASVMISSIPVKTSLFATIKSCNYLANVLMKKECVDAGADFALALDNNGNLAEGATENAAIITPSNQLVTPPARHVLPGTTLNRVLELAETLVKKKKLTGIDRRDIPRAELDTAKEILIIGTTPNVTSVVKLEGQLVGNGRPGSFGTQLNQLLREDMLNNPALLTPVF